MIQRLRRPRLCTAGRVGHRAVEATSAVASSCSAEMKGNEGESIEEPQQVQGSSASLGARREDGGGGVPIADDEVPRAALRGRNLGLEIRERQDRVQEQDAIDPPAPEDGA